LTVRLNEKADQFTCSPAPALDLAHSCLLWKRAAPKNRPAKSATVADLLSRIHFDFDVQAAA